MKIRSYSELKRFANFEERYQYLRLGAVVGKSTFGFDRHINQMLYHSIQWRRARDAAIVRDSACDLGLDGYEIRAGKILVHHMNPITMDDFEIDAESLFNPEFLICTSEATHNAIHFGDESLLPKQPIERKRNDTLLW